MREVTYILGLVVVILGFACNLAKAETVQFRTFVYTDRQGTGGEAFRLLMPTDWEFDGGVLWVMDNPLIPAVASFRVRNPRGTEELEVFPNQGFWWTADRAKLSLHPIGSKYFGSTVHPPLPAADLVKQILIPLFRRDVSGLKIVKTEPVPELKKLVEAINPPQFGLTMQFDSVKARIEYNRAGRQYEEEMYAVTEVYTYPVQTMFGPVATTNWLGTYLFSVKAEKGKLDASEKTFKTMVTSFQLSAQWYNTYVQVVELLIKYQTQKIIATGKIGSIISQTSSEIREDRLKTWEKQQGIYDRMSTDFCQHIRGVDEYFDPVAGKPVELPSGYTSGWTNGLGDYIISDSPSYNPNIGSNQNWQRMEMRR